MSAAKSRRRVGGAVFICVPDETPGPRDDCPNALHDHPLPSGYIAASDVATRRLGQHWRNAKCPDCGLYGWGRSARWFVVTGQPNDTDTDDELWLHFTDAESLVVESRTQEHHRRTKPDGFWISDESSDDGWSHWARGEDYTIGASAFRVRLADDAKLLRLSTVAEVVEFHRAYSLRDTYGWNVDWPAVAEVAQGIIIAPYQWKLRLSPDVSWYYTWDCASGCIWDAAAIAAVERVSSLEPSR